MNVFFLDGRKEAEVDGAFKKVLWDTTNQQLGSASIITRRKLISLTMARWPEVAIVATFYTFKNICKESYDDVSNTG
jgi:hypothetical protein